MSEDILEARANVKKIRSQLKTRLRRRRLRKAEKKLAKLLQGLEQGAKEVVSIKIYITAHILRTKQFV